MLHVKLSMVNDQNESSSIELQTRPAVNTNTCASASGQTNLKKSLAKAWIGRGFNFMTQIHQKLYILMMKIIISYNKLTHKTYLYQLCLFLVFFLLLQQVWFDNFLFRNSTSLCFLVFLIFWGQMKMLFDRAFMHRASKFFKAFSSATSGTLLVLQTSFLLVASR